MPYKPTGNPPGRPRKTASVNQPVAFTEEIISWPEVLRLVDDAPASPKPTAVLSRAREGFRRAFADTAAGLHRPPRYGARKRQQVNKRPILHPNVIAKAN
jgi:hypothetical protein